ncbi:nitroreductase family protein [Nocardioides yefusunii]|uniref:Nitroreductase family protein n=1 Tax=Nocardioides yefusunii TaxID=2500546 RepID=A0ABW1R2F9_9ACTN|nr:nitroreductase family protein [Nocardioides yefusunii]
MLTRIARKVRNSLPSRGGAPTPAPTPSVTATTPMPEGLSPKQQRQFKLTQAVLREATLDSERFAKYSVPVGGTGRYSWMRGMRLDASATRLYHRIEKGLSLPKPRHPFGAVPTAKMEKVLANPHHDTNALYRHEIDSTLAALKLWNEHEQIDNSVAPVNSTLPGNPISAEEAAAFVTSRRSIRHFAPKAIDRALITEATRIAMSSPSVCNRQSWRAHYFDSAKDLAAVMPLHSGSAGFGDNVRGVFVVTFDIRTFEGPTERNQGWIDGGMFAQTLLLGLHAVGLGAVPLNWSRMTRASNTLRETAGIPEYENIVMLIGVGHPAEGHRVARSARRPIEEILRFGTTK